MATSKKSFKYSRYGLTNPRKKLAINIWRSFFTGYDKKSGSECSFFLELEFLNPWISPSSPLLGYKSRVSITEDDLQYALAGTQSATELQAEALVLPSYVVIRFGRAGRYCKQLCAYHSLQDLKYSAKPFSVQAGNKFFSEDTLSGFINLSEEEVQRHPEYMCESGHAAWNLKYEIEQDSFEGYSNKTDRWFPFGVKVCFSGLVNFDGRDYIVEPKKSFGYMDRFWGKSLPETWVHLSSSSLTSVITGKTMFDSSFAIQGDFEGRISLIGRFEGNEVSFTADSSKRRYSSVWDCIQTPEKDEQNDDLLHWAVSVSDRNYVIDIDVYCKINELYNRKLELPEGKRKILSVLQGETGTGEVKIFRRIKDSLEQIEHARIGKSACEFGHWEEADL